MSIGCLVLGYWEAKPKLPWIRKRPRKEKRKPSLKTTFIANA
jgi:hypothetical protein